jgi:hypothetical protein
MVEEPGGEFNKFRNKTVKLKVSQHTIKSAVLGDRTYTNYDIEAEDPIYKQLTAVAEAAGYKLSWALPLTSQTCDWNVNRVTVHGEVKDDTFTIRSFPIG